VWRIGAGSEDGTEWMRTGRKRVVRRDNDEL
jgi:hypothetical protein